MTALSRIALNFTFGILALLWGNLTFAQGNYPENVILTRNQESSSSQSVSWRTDDLASAPLAQLVLVDDSPVNQDLKSVIPRVLHLKDVQNREYYYYTATFENLVPGQTYRYRVGDEQGEWTAWNHFSTADNGLEPYSFLYLGDIQNDILAWRTRAMRAAYSKAPHAGFMLFAGDCVNDGHDGAQWKDWFRRLRQIPDVMTIVPATGNHKYDDLPGEDESTLSPFRNAQFKLPQNGPKGLEESVFYVDYQSMRLVILNSLMALNSEEDLKVQTEWLESVLKNNPQKWTVVSYHHPLFSARAGNHEDYPELRAAWQPLFEKHKTDLVLQGHDHMYGRGNRQYKTIEVPEGQAGPVYLVSVAGPKMYGILPEKRWMDRLGLNTQFYQQITIDGGKLEFRTYTVRGELYDSFDLLKQENSYNRFIEHISSKTYPEKLFPGGAYNRSPK